MKRGKQAAVDEAVSCEDRSRGKQAVDETVSCDSPKRGKQAVDEAVSCDSSSKPGGGRSELRQEVVVAEESPVEELPPACEDDKDTVHQEQEKRRSCDRSPKRGKAEEPARQSSEMGEGQEGNVVTEVVEGEDEIIQQFLLRTGSS